MRQVTVSAVSFRLPEPGKTTTRKKLLEQADEMVAAAAARGSDIVAFPETFLALGTPPKKTDALIWEAVTTGQEDRLPGLVRKKARHTEPIPGPTTDHFSHLAKQHSMYIICPLMENDGGTIHNSAPVIGRRGEVVGVYRKTHEMPGGVAAGVRPGEDIPVFPLDFGVIGVTICMDIYYPELYRVLALRGAEIIFWVTMATQPRQCLDVQLLARAVDYNVYMAISNFVFPPPYVPHGGRNRRGEGRIVDYFGNVLANTGYRAGLATATIDLDEEKLSSGCISLPERVRKGEPDHFRPDLLRTRRPPLYTDVCQGEDELMKIYNRIYSPKGDA